MPSANVSRFEGESHPRPSRPGPRELLVFGLVIIASFCLPACRRGAESGARKVPVILLSIDTLRADHLSCYGYGLETSPAIDRFAREAVLFENAISPSPVTTPAHVSIFTATTPAVHGRMMISNFGGQYEPLPAGIISATEVLKANGYITLGLHGGGNVDGVCGLKRGFDYYAPVPAESLNSRLEDMIHRCRTPASPFFIFLHHYLCHDPYTKGPRDLRLRFAKSRLDELGSIIDEMEDPDLTHRRRRFWTHFKVAGQADRELVRDLYDGGVLCSDSLFAGMIDVIKREGLYEDALIIVLSDHGEEFFEHGGKLHARLFIETLHVPLLIKFPRGKFGGRRIPDDVRTFDLFPTIFEYLGITERPASFQGESFLPLISGGGRYEPLVMSFSPWGDRIRFHDQGFVFANEPTNKARIPNWLFDRKKDPQEQVNLADSRPDLLRRMESRSREILREQQELALLFKNQSGVRVEIDKEVLERLRALGYIK
jgi:arylsulfatase A-like enzyme